MCELGEDAEMEHANIIFEALSHNFNDCNFTGYGFCKVSQSAKAKFFTNTL